MLPALPSWEGLHPIVVHFPIALLLIAPVFIVLAAFQKQGRGFAISALIMLAIGAAFVFLAVATGEAAEDQAEAVPAAKAVFERHEELAEIARPVFAGLAALYGAILVSALVLKERLKRPVWAGLNAGFLLLFAGGALLLANIAHEGGRLVHEFGVRAPIAGAAPNGGSGVPARRSGDEDD